jgi:hypothetical protein
MIYKLTSINVVISKIVRDLGLGHYEIPAQDFIEWIGEGLAHIGAYAQFTPKESIVPIVNHVGQTPCDFYQLIELREGCSCKTQTASRYDIVSDGMKALGLQDADDPTVVSPRTFQLLQLAVPAAANDIDFYNNSLMKLKSNESFINTWSVDYSIGARDYRYVKEGNYFQTTFSEGFLAVRYLAFPVDCDGYPLVPDDPSFKDALFWKVAYHLAMRGYLFPNPEMRSLTFCKRKWDFYCKQARGVANSPDLETLHQISNIWNSLMPYMDEHEQDYKNVGRNNYINFDGRW